MTLSLSSFNFIIFFVTVYGLVSVARLIFRKASFKDILTMMIMLVASYFFIFISDWRFAICILGITIISYLNAIYIEKSNKPQLLIVGGVLL